MIIKGDLEQHDRIKEKSGLDDFIKRVSNYEGRWYKTFRFSNNDIKREAIVKDILNIYY